MACELREKDNPLMQDFSFMNYVCPGFPEKNKAQQANDGSLGIVSTFSTLSTFSYSACRECPTSTLKVGETHFTPGIESRSMQRLESIPPAFTDFKENR